MRRKTAGVRDVLHRVRWGQAALSGVIGYFAPSTAEKLGVGALLQNIPGYSKVLAKMQAASSAPEWQGDGLVGFAKLAALGLAGKQGYDYLKTGRISDAKLSMALPFELGVILDTVGDESGGSFAMTSGGVSW